jgi:hypothetical protein
MAINFDEYQIFYLVIINKEYSCYFYNQILLLENNICTKTNSGCCVENTLTLSNSV